MDDRGLGIVEVKCLGAVKHAQCLLTGQPPKEFRYQMQFYMWGLGADFCDYVSYHPGMPERKRLKVVKVPRDEDVIALLAKRTEAILVQAATYSYDLGVRDWKPYHERHRDIAFGTA